ncbi:unnamed protein product [Mytilus edulis]|uniref:Uncharacterized protein n=1 Tax=Mytilus edulis TaxID=6550 RepID=A0A8S3QWA0_MYTED|nr:unnamed protein product [Mytilus edulis]
MVHVNENVSDPIDSVTSEDEIHNLQVNLNDCPISLDDIRSCLPDMLVTDEQKLLQNFDLTATFVRVDEGIAMACLKDLYSDLILRFCRVSDNQFRKDVIKSFGMQKSETLRKRVVETAKRDNTSKQISMSYILNDKSENKISLHLKLQSCICDSGTLVLKCFTKKQLMCLGKAYDTNMSIKDNKQAMCDNLLATVPNFISIPNVGPLTKSEDHEQAQVVENLEQAQVVENLEQAQVVENLEQAQVVENLEQAQVVENLEQAQVVENLEQAQVVENLEQVVENQTLNKHKLLNLEQALENLNKQVVENQVVENLEQAQVVENLEQAQVVENLEQAQVVENIEQAQVVENLEQAQVVENIEQAQVVENLEQAQVVENIEHVPVVENIEQAQVVENLEQVVAQAQVVENLEQAQVVENLEQEQVVENIEQAPVVENIEHVPVVEDRKQSAAKKGSKRKRKSYTS